MSRFSFAFDSPAFSDRVLLLCANSSRSFRAEEAKAAASFLAAKPLDEDGDEDLVRNAKDSKTDDPAQGRVVLRKIAVSSMLLASDSRFFKAMLSNGMKESGQKEIVLEVADEREAEHVVTLLKFLYTGELAPAAASAGSAASAAAAFSGIAVASGAASGFSAFSNADVLALLLQADKLGIDSAVSTASGLLCKELSLDTSAFYLALPDSLAMNDACRELMTRSRQFLAAHFRDFDSVWDSDAFLQLNAKAVVAVLNSDELDVRSENTVFQAAKKWWRRSPHSPFHSLLASAGALGMGSWPSPPPPPGPTSIAAVSPSAVAGATVSAAGLHSHSQSQQQHQQQQHRVETKGEHKGAGSSGSSGGGGGGAGSGSSIARPHTQPQQTSLTPPPSALGGSSSSASGSSSLSAAMRRSPSPQPPPLSTAGCEAYAQTALSLLQAVRFTCLSPDFLLDVVKHDDTFAQLQPPSFASPGALRAQAATAAAIAAASPAALRGGPASASSASASGSPAPFASPATGGSSGSSGSSGSGVFSPAAASPSASGLGLGAGLAHHHSSGSGSSVDKSGGGGFMFTTTGVAAALDRASRRVRKTLDEIEGVSKMVEGRYQFSPSFFVDGYYFRLQAGRIRWERNDGFAFALFLSLDMPATGLAQERGFFVQTESQFLVRNAQTQQMEPTHLPSFDTFTSGVCELGYFDVFKKSWSELVSSASPLVDAHDSLELSVRVKLLT